MVAAFWDDSDLNGLGYALYDVITIADDAFNTTNKVKNFIKDKEGVALNPDWVLVARWIDICPYQNMDCTAPILEVNL